MNVTRCIIRKNGGPCWIRTSDQLVKSPLLYFRLPVISQLFTSTDCHIVINNPTSGGRISAGAVLRYVALFWLVFMTLAGCDSGGRGGQAMQQTAEPSPTYVGDSLCAGKGSPARQLDMSLSCYPGAKLMDAEGLPPGRIFLGLGTNDAGSEVNIYLFEMHLIALLDTATGRVTCILPSVANYDTTAYRDALKRNCDDYIDPFEYGVVGMRDGVHWDAAENYIMTNVLASY